jgi:hypothetical protein
MDESDLKPVLHEVEEPRSAATLKLDITTLKNGEIIEGRSKFIERIGKGAFGTVLLMEDTVVDDRWGRSAASTSSSGRSCSSPGRCRPSWPRSAFAGSTTISAASTTTCCSPCSTWAT